MKAQKYLSKSVITKLKELHIKFEDPKKTLERLEDAVELSLQYYLLISMSSIIATFGLIQDSPAVIIGAMVVAPFMVPLFAFSYGANWAKLGLIWKSSISIFKGSLLAFGVSCFITLFIYINFDYPFMEIPSEILVRTRPSPFDFIVAFAAGIAGAYGYIDKNVKEFGEYLVGVAIAVALMPPLCTSGIGLGLSFITGRHEITIGAGLLFLLNLFCILLAGIIIFFIYHVVMYFVEN